MWMVDASKCDIFRENTVSVEKYVYHIDKDKEDLFLVEYYKHVTAAPVAERLRALFLNHSIISPL